MPNSSSWPLLVIVIVVTCYVVYTLTRSENGNNTIGTWWAMMKNDFFYTKPAQHSLRVTRKLESAATTTTTTKEKKKTLITFLAGANSNRTHVVFSNLEMFNIKSDTYQFDCLILLHCTYAQARVAGYFDDAVLSKCAVRVLYGFSYAKKLAHLSPLVLKQTEYDYLTIVLDDIQLVGWKGSTFNLEEYFNIVYQLDLSVACPSVNVDYWQHMTQFGGLARQTHHCSARKVNMIEIQAITLRMDAWSCWYEMNDLEFPHGWGTDLWFQEYCLEKNRLDAKKRKTMAVIDKFVAINHNFATSMSGTHSQFTLLREQLKAWKKQRGVRLSTYEEFKAEKRNVENIHGKCLLL